MAGMGKTQAARKRAADSRIRAVCDVPGQRYRVYSNHRAYTVWLNHAASTWECTCAATTVCKHIVRVMDREEERIKLEALEHEQRSSS
jgi:uncharacterized Zn finger protein